MLAPMRSPDPAAEPRLRSSRLTVRVADISVALYGPPDIALDVSGACAKFLAAENAAECEIEVDLGSLAATAAEHTVFDSGCVWRLTRCGGDLLFDFASPVFGTLPYKQARFRTDFRSGSITMRRECFPVGVVRPLEYPLDELLFINLLAQGRGAEVHACGLRRRDDAGYLFVGASGTGKSTTARLWNGIAGVEVLSDDRIVLRRSGGTTWMYGTPWHGESEFAMASRAPLRKVFFLAHGTGNEAIPLRPADAVARLMACSFVPFYSAAGLDYTLGFFEQLARDVPCWELKFVPNAEVVDFVENGLP